MLQYFLTYLRTVLRQEDGQDLAEYALLIGLIALVVVGAVLALGGELTAVFDRICHRSPGLAYRRLIDTLLRTRLLVTSDVTSVRRPAKATTI